MDSKDKFPVDPGNKISDIENSIKPDLSKADIPDFNWTPPTPPVPPPVTNNNSGTSNNSDESGGSSDE